MPFGTRPLCSQCRVTSSVMWRKGAHGEVLCNSCGLIRQKVINERSKTSADGRSTPNSKDREEGSARKKAKPRAKSTKGKGRRTLLKDRQPTKSPGAEPTVVTGECIFHNGVYYQAGDIVSLVDQDNSLYYAQLRSFMQDPAGEKSAVITWLLPTAASPRGHFDPSTYFLGPQEDFPRKLSCMEFVCNAPSDFYRPEGAPYPTVSLQTQRGFIWTAIGPPVVSAPSIDEIFGPPTQESTSGQKELQPEKDRNEAPGPQPGPKPGTSSEPGSQTGPKANNISSEPGPQAGPQPRTSVELGPQAGPQPGTSSEPGPQAGPGSGTSPKSGPQAGPKVNTSSEPGPQAGPQTGTNPKPGPQAGPEPGTSSGPGPQAGPQAGPQTGTSPKPGPQAGPEPGISGNPIGQSGTAASPNGAKSGDSAEEASKMEEEAREEGKAAEAGEEMGDSAGGLIPPDLRA